MREKQHVSPGARRPATSRDYGVFDTDANDVAAIVAVFNADYTHTSITPSDGDDLVWSPTDSQTHLLALINGAQHSLDIEQEEFSDTTLVNAIVADENRGVTVRVVIEDPSEYTSELNKITAFNAGGCKNAVCRQLNPPHDFPIIPTVPLHHGWSASHSMTSQASARRKAASSRSVPR